MTYDLNNHSLSANEMEELVDSALTTMLWTSGDIMEDDGETSTLKTWDEVYGPEDATPELREKLTAELSKFVEDNAQDVTDYLNSPATREFSQGGSIGQLGHDYILTAGHHGVGFWDRGLGDLGDRLTETAHKGTEWNVFAGEGAVEPLNVTWAGKFHAE